MKMRLSVLVFVVMALGASSVRAQTIQRARACSVNDGFSMADVVETARNINWSEATAPVVVRIREAVAVAGPFQEDYDFVFELYYSSYADMVEKRGAFRRLPGGRNGRGFSDVATCSEAVRISNVTFATPPRGNEFPQATLFASTLCELNGASIADAVTLAGTIGENLGAVGAVFNRTFGGPRVPRNSSVSFNFLFPSPADFGTALDRIRQNPATPDQQNAISCSVGSFWVSHVIHRRTN